MRKRLMPAVFGLALAVAGCGSSAGPAATSTPSAGSPTPPTTPPVQATPTIVVGKQYLAFVRSLCRAMARKDAQAIINDLPYYQYNSGLRWGMMGDGAGQTSDPTQLRTWLAASSVRCSTFTPGQNAHGTVLAGGFTQPGPWALIEVDIFNGHWKINDFTFGRRNELYRAMQTAGPLLQFRG